MRGEWGGTVEIRREGAVSPAARFSVTSNLSIFVLRLDSAGPWELKVIYSQTSGPEGDYEVVIAPKPAGSEGAGDVFALPLRAPNSAREHVLVPGGLARAVGTLPGAEAASADARADAQGRWPTVLSGVEARVAGQPARVLAVRRRGADGYEVDFVVPAQVTPAASGPRVPVVVRHAPSGALWRLGAAELVESAPVLWGQQVAGQSTLTAIALESPTLLAFSEDRRVSAGSETRVMLFVSGLGIGRTAENTRLVARLPDGSRVALPTEHVGPTSLPGLYQIIFKADNILSGHPRVLLSVEGGEEAWVSLPLQ